MKHLIAAFLLCSSVALASAEAGSVASPTLKSVLLAQLKSTHNSQEWFVPAIPALAGLTVEQAVWKPGSENHSSSDNHSIAQLVNHLTFWNKRQLAKFKGEPPAPTAATTPRHSCRSSTRRPGTPPSGSWTKC